MLQTISNLSDIDVLPEYPIPPGERLESHSFFLFHYRRFLASDLFMRTKKDREVLGYALVLWCRSQEQDPVGTLPSDPALLASMLDISMDEWEALRRRDPDPLYGWVQCRAGGQVRLMHPVVTSVTKAAVGSHVLAEDKRQSESDRKKFNRMRDNVRELTSDYYADNPAFLTQLWDAMERLHPGVNWNSRRYAEGMRACGVDMLRAAP